MMRELAIPSKEVPMGFSIYYRSTRPVLPPESDTIRQAAHAANEGRTWLSCEPVHFYRGEEDGHLLGSSKPNFLPHPDDAAAAAQEGLPDGTTRDMLDILCRLSREHGIDWELSHDHDPSIGFIRAGVCDEEAISQIEVFGDLGDILAGELEGLMDEEER